MTRKLAFLTLAAMFATAFVASALVTMCAAMNGGCRVAWNVPVNAVVRASP